MDDQQWYERILRSIDDPSLGLPGFPSVYQQEVFVGQGWYDFATPFFAAEYALTRNGFPQDRIEYQYYDSGHMMYVRDEDRRKLSADIRNFIRAR